jgi:hypothetical protein
MFPLIRPHRQVAATLAVLAFTVAPTVYVAWTAWQIGRPGHCREVEAEIGRRLGLQARLGAVRYPRPGEVVFRDVVLRQEEPRGNGLIEVARADSVRLRRGDRELTLETRGLRLGGEGPREVMAQVGALLQRSVGSSFDRVTLSAPTCELDLGAGVAPFKLREVIGDYVADPVAPSVRASYRVVSESSSPRCELTLTRDRKDEPVRTTLTLRTMEGLPLPARVLDSFFEAEAWLGADAKVEGALTLVQEGSKDWEAAFQGHLVDVDLTTLVERRFPEHRLKGRARLAVESARWGDRPGQGFGWVEARGELTTGPGVIGLGLVQALSTEMKFRKGPRLGRIASAGLIDLDFRALAFRFAMTSDGEIRVTGALGDEFGGDVVLMGPTDTLAFAPEGAANVRGLIKTLFPVKEINHAVMVPLTEKSRLLLCLPVGPDLAAKPIGGN